MSIIKTMLKSIKLTITIIILSLTTTTSLSKTVILGFDGMDPKLAEQWMASGDLPHFKKLAETGHFQPLSTTNPAQSPVAWSSFATGLNPGEHGIFDFIHRDPKTFEPVYSISGFKQPEMFDLFGWKIPVSGSNIYNKRLGKPFWLTAQQAGNNSSVLRVPVTYPPDNISSMLSGMGVPDLLGSQGTYTFYATKFINKSEKGGNIVRVKVNKNSIVTQLDGPPNPYGGGLLSIPLTMEKASADSMQIKLDDTELTLQQGSWSEWVPISFSYGGVFSLSGMVRIHLIESFPRVKLYISPININPQSAELPIANPPEFAIQLSDDIGLYHTLGMPEETWSLNDGMIDGETFLQMVKTVLAEREKMFFKQLDDDSIELLIEVFVQTDRVSHMFWRGHDPNHPTYSTTNEIERNAIKWIYQEADRILGKTLSKLNPDDKLIVLSDHGFAPYYKHVNLNRWLLDEGYLSLKTNNTETFSLKDVNWEKTKAYAMGLNGIYLNLKNRESFGTVTIDEVKQVSDEIAAKLSTLTDPDNTENVVNHVYSRSEIYSGAESKNSPDLVVGYKRGYRASWQTVLGEAPKDLFSINSDMWSGDHCIDPVLVPGVLFTNFHLNQTHINSIKNIGSLALSNLKNTALINDETHSGFLDLPRDVTITLLNPVQKYLPATLALLLSGVFLFLLLLVSFNLLNLLPKIKFVSFVLKGIVTISFFVVFLNASQSVFSENHIIENDKINIAVTAISNNELPLLKWINNENKPFSNIDKIGKNKWSYQLNDKPIILLESDGYELVKLSNETPIYSKVQKNWWHNILSNKGGYINQFSQVEKIIILSITNNNNIWWLWFLVGFSLPLIVWKKSMKIK